mgnify:CR=1 FL=1
MRVKFRIAHAVAVGLKEVDPFAGFLAALAVLGQGLNDRVDISGIEFAVAEFGPPLCTWIGGAINRFGDRAKTFFDMVAVGDLSSAGEQLGAGIPDPGSTIAENGTACRLIETATRGFSPDPLGELRTFRRGIQSGGAFQSGGVSN